MHFTGTTSILIASALQLSNVAAQRPDWTVKIFTDGSCDSSTGFYSHNDEKSCESLDSFSVDIMSIQATGDNVDARCGSMIYAYEGDNCDGELWPLTKGRCYEAGVGDLDSIGSFAVVNTPCD